MENFTKRNRNLKISKVLLKS